MNNTKHLGQSISLGLLLLMACVGVVSLMVTQTTALP